MRLKLKWGDALVIVFITALAVFMLVWFHQESTSSATAVITQNNTVLAKVRLDHLSEPYILNYTGKYPGVIEAKDGKIRFAHAECPDQVCVHTGWIYRPGEIAVCLPAGVMIKIEGEDSDLDLLVR